MAEIKKTNIYEALNVAMKEIGAVAKNSRNTFDGYKFRGIDAVMNALQPALKTAGITIVPTVLEQLREDRLSKKGEAMIYTVLKIKYTFYALDGSSVEAVVIGEAMDRSDKSTNKAMSAAFKYAAFQVLCIPTEEMLDADAETPEPAPKEEAPKAEAPKKPAQVITVDQAKELKGLLEELGTDVKAFLGYYKVDCVDNMSPSMYRHAREALAAKKKPEGGKE